MEPGTAKCIEVSPLHWRLISDGPHSASWNMAMDAAILDAVSAGIAPPTLRLYTWDEPAVTVGMHQNVSAGLHLAFCEREGIHIVRRPTGGRGILHGTDLTVSIALPVDALPATQRSVVDSYRYLSLGFVQALSLLGLDGGMGEGDRGEASGGDCFAVRSRADVVTLAGRKLVGSAQRRRDGSLLQQSSIRYRRPKVAASDVFLGTVEEGEYPLQNLPEQRLSEAVGRGYVGLFERPPEVCAGASAWEEERCATLVRTYAPLAF